MWIVLAFVSALCLGFYDISKKIALRDHHVVDVLTASVLISAGILAVPLLLSRLCPEAMSSTPFFVPRMDLQAHLLILIKSVIVLSSWIFAYVALKHLPISVVSPWQATRPMWTLIGAMLLFGERLNGGQWAGVVLAIGSIFAFSFASHRSNHPSLEGKSKIKYLKSESCNKYYIALALAILIGSCSGLYDKFMMRHYDHNAVQVYYTFYQALMMLVVWGIAKRGKSGQSPKEARSLLPIALISIFLVISDNVYMLALRDPDSLIAVVSTIRRGGAVISFAYGLLLLREKDPVPKILCMLGIIAGLICLAVAQ